MVTQGASRRPVHLKAGMGCARREEGNYPPYPIGAPRVTHTDVSLYQIELALLTSSGCRSISVIERISTEQISNK
jgi:hypothetical protein